MTDRSLNASVRHRLFQLILEKAVKTTESEGKIYSGLEGVSYSWLFSFHDFFVDPESLETFADLFWEKYGHLSPLQVGGLETSGIPLVIAVVQKAQELGYEASGFFVRKQRKPGGLARLIDGRLSGIPIVIVDDVFKTGSSMEKVMVALESVGTGYRHACTMVDFDWNAGKLWKQQRGVHLEAFFKPDDFGLSNKADISNAAMDARSEAKISYELKWSFSSPGALPYYFNPKSTPLVENGAVFVGSDSGVFWCLDEKTGDVRWDFDTNTLSEKGIWSSPSYHDGGVLFGAYNGFVYNLDASSGELIWKTLVSDWVGSSPLPVPDKNLVLVGVEYARSNGSGGLAALSLETGEKIWEFPLEELQHGSPTYWPEGELVVFGTSDNFVAATSCSTGELVWKCHTRGPVKYAPKICTNRKIAAFGCHDGSIRVVSLHDGSVLFELNTNAPCYTTPLVAGDKLFCGSTDGHMYICCLETGELLHKIQTSGKIFSEPSIVGGNVVFGTTYGVVEEICSRTFRTVGAKLFPDAIVNRITPVGTGEALIVPTLSNEIFCVSRHIDISADI